MSNPYLNNFDQPIRNLIKAKLVKVYYIGNENRSQCSFFVQKVITSMSGLLDFKKKPRDIFITLVIGEYADEQWVGKHAHR